MKTASPRITPTALRRAADVQERIFRLEAELSSILNGSTASRAYGRGGDAEGESTTKTGRPKRKMSAAHKAKIAAAARARWAKIRNSKA